MSMPQQSQTKPSITWTNASTRSVSGTKFVSRQLGADSGVPVIFLNHLVAELDRWDPREHRTRSRRWRGTPSLSSERWVWNKLTSSASRSEVLFHR